MHMLYFLSILYLSKGDNAYTCSGKNAPSLFMFIEQSWGYVRDMAFLS